MTIAEIDDHAEKIRERYPDRYRPAVNHQKLVDIFGSRFQELETQLFNILNERHLSVAVGVQLDGLGQILDLDREVGETDEPYRARLVGRTGELAKSGEMENLITAFLTLSGGDSVESSDYYPAGVLMASITDADAEDPDVDAEINEQMALVKAAGIQLILLYSLENGFELSDESEADINNDGPIDADKGLGTEIGDFIALSQTSRGWAGMTTGDNGDVYASVSGGDIYKQTGGAGNFIALGQTVRNWAEMTTGANGDVYAAVSNGDIYKQTGSEGDFIALGQTVRNWRGMTTGDNGDVYASVFSGDIYKQTGGEGDFIALSQTSRNWRSMTTGSNGDIYAAVSGGDIYNQTGGVGNFIALGQTIRNWEGMTTGSNGDVYASVSGADIYNQTGGVGNFIALGQTSRGWGVMTTGSNGDVYAAVSSGDIYKQTGSEGGGLSRVIA